MTRDADDKRDDAADSNQIMDERGDAVRVNLAPVMLMMCLCGAILATESATAGWPWKSDGPRRGTKEWWDFHASRPVGGRQVEKYGKVWPPQPRPDGAELPGIHKYHAAHYWPYPYYCEDRAYVREFSSRQVAAGWIAATTLFDYHFDPDSNELTRSGALHLRWILENAPEPHRIAFVQTGETQNVSHERLASVQQMSAELVHGQNVPPIMLRVTSPLGRPADEILNIHRTELATQPEPRILYTPLPTGVGGGN